MTRKTNLLKSTIVVGTVAPLAVTAMAQEASAATTTYKVQKGDTLYKIATKFKTSVTNLTTLNKIKNANLIFPGQVLTLTPPSAPAKPATNSSSQTPASKPAVQPATPATATKTYTVKKGDTLWGISQKTGVSVATLLAGNHGSSLIYPNQVLTLAATGTSSSSKTPAASSSSTGSLTTAQRQAITKLSLSLSQQHIPYVWGGSTTAGFDCSGLVSYVYQKTLGVTLPHNTVLQEKSLNLISVSQAQPGDVLFWGNKGSSYHDAIYLGNNQYVAAPVPGMNVEVESIVPSFTPSFAGTLK